MLTLAEDILLLMLDDDSGKMTNADPLATRYALGGSILMGLAVRSKIKADAEKLTVVDKTETGIELLDKYLEKISNSENDESTLHWVNFLSNRSDEIQKEALNMLVEKRILKEEEKKILWVFETRRYPMIDDKEEKEVKKRIIDLLYNEDTPTPKDAVLISLVDTCGLLANLLSNKEIENLSERISEIKSMDVIGQVVSKAVAQLHMDIAQAMSMAH